MEPRYEALTPEQDAVLEAPLAGATIVSGGPGTGKSTVAIYRALLHHATGDTVLVVVPDRQRQICLIRRLGDQSKVVQVITWVELVDKMVPGLRARHPTSTPDFWDQALMQLARQQNQIASGQWAVVMDDAH